MRKIARWAIRPIVHAWVASKAEELHAIPRPFDELTTRTATSNAASDS